MKVDKRAKFSIFFILAIVALGLSNIAAVYTGDLLSGTLPGINETEKLIALDDDGFSPASLNTVYEEKKVVEEVNDTADVNDTNDTSTEISTDTTNTEDNSKSNANTESNSNDGSSDSVESGSSSQVVVEES